jgi:hypothetical protein
MTVAEAPKLQMNASGIRLIASSLMVLMSSVFSNKSFLDALATADTSGSSLIKNHQSLSCCEAPGALPLALNTPYY